MPWPAAASTLLYIAVGTVVGVKLMVAGWRIRKLPDFLVGAHLFNSVGLGYSMMVVGSQPGWLSPRGGAILTALGSLWSDAGFVCLYVFTWLVFRRRARWAQGLVVAALAAHIVKALGHIRVSSLAASYEEAIALAVGYHVLGVAIVCCMLSWSAFESLRYYRLLRRRLRVGLANPLTANRFLLWGIGNLNTVIGGIAVSSIMVTAEVGTAIVVWYLIAATGFLSSLAYLLAFLPPEGYARWIRSRAARRLGASD